MPSTAQAPPTALSTAQALEVSQVSTPRDQDTADRSPQDQDTAVDTAEEEDTAQVPTAEAMDTEEDTAQTDMEVYDGPGFLRAMQAEDYFATADLDDIEEDQEGDDGDQDDSDAVDSEADEADCFDMLYDTFDDEEAGSEVDDGDADTCKIDDDKEALRELSANGWLIFDERRSHMCALTEAGDFYKGKPRPTKSAQAFADSPLGLFFYFLPKVLWKKIADETNRYRADSVDDMATERQRQQRARHDEDPNVNVQSLQEIRDELAKWKPVQAHEVVQFVGLLLARALCPQRVALSRHWTTQEAGAVPRGTFGRFMSRARFEDITRFLHFNNNADDNRLRDRAWKVRPLLQVVQKTFRRGFLLGKTISFDEGMIGSRHRMNPMRVYMKAKPTKWGTKFYMTCCAETAYCARYVYLYSTMLQHYDLTTYVVLYHTA
jgi:hypothetical protein